MPLHPLTALTTTLPSVLAAADPGVTSNTTGLPGLAQLRSMVGALLTFGLVACVAALVIAGDRVGAGVELLQPAHGRARQDRRVWSRPARRCSSARRTRS